MEAFSSYITYERRAKNPDLLVTRGVFERAISEAAKRVLNQEPNAGLALATFWSGYLDATVSHLQLVRVRLLLIPSKRLLDVGVDVESELFKRALRSVPGSGEIWSRYIRFLVCSVHAQSLGRSDSAQ